MFADVSDAVRQLLDAYGLTPKIGAGNLFASVGEAVDAYRASGTTGTPPAGTTPPAPETPAPDSPAPEGGPA